MLRVWFAAATIALCAHSAEGKTLCIQSSCTDSVRLDRALSVRGFRLEANLDSAVNSYGHLSQTKADAKLALSRTFTLESGVLLNSKLGFESNLTFPKGDKTAHADAGFGLSRSFTLGPLVLAPFAGMSYSTTLGGKDGLATSLGANFSAALPRFPGEPALSGDAILWSYQKTPFSAPPTLRLDATARFAIPDTSIWAGLYASATLDPNAPRQVSWGLRAGFVF